MRTDGAVHIEAGWLVQLNLRPGGGEYPTGGAQDRNAAGAAGGGSFSLALAARR